MMIHQKDGRLRTPKSNHCDRQWIRGCSHFFKRLDLNSQFNCYKILHYNPTCVQVCTYIQAHANWVVDLMDLPKVGRLPIILQYVYVYANPENGKTFCCYSRPKRRSSSSPSSQLRMFWAIRSRLHKKVPKALLVFNRSSYRYTHNVLFAESALGGLRCRKKRTSGRKKKKKSPRCPQCHYWKL